MLSGLTPLSGLQVIDIVDVVIFFALEYLCYLIFYFIQKVDPERSVTPSVFLLSLGINLVGFSFLFRIGRESNISQFVTVSILGGSLAILIGGITLYYRKSIQVADLRKRHDEVKSIIKNMKEKYYRQEITEDDLKSINAGLVKELAEIEVMLEGKKKEKVKDKAEKEEKTEKE
jgi:hypothetical protein